MQPVDYATYTAFAVADEVIVTKELSDAIFGRFKFVDVTDSDPVRVIGRYVFDSLDEDGRADKRERRIRSTRVIQNRSTASETKKMKKNEEKLSK